MPRHDWDDDTMSRDREHRDHDHRHDRDRWEMRDRERDEDRRRDRRDDESGAFFEHDANRHPHDERYAIGGWGDRDRERSRDRDRDRDRERSRDREDRRYGSDDHNRGIPMDETQRLIASNKVEGTPVYDRHGDKLGTIHNFMVDKRRGKVVYAVLKHGGGFLGLGERYYPLEWDQLTYDTRLEGYATDLTEEDLKNFGSFDSQGRYHRRQPRGRRSRDDRDSW